MLDYGPDGNKYRYTGSYPQKNDFYTYYLYKEGQLVFKFGFNCPEVSSADLDTFLDKKFPFVYNNIQQVFTQLEKYFTVEKNFNIEAYNHEYELIRVETAKLHDMWEHDLYEHYGVDPKSHVVQLVMSKAWEDGHSSGFYEVEMYFDRYLEFMEDVIEAIKKDEIDASN